MIEEILKKLESMDYLMIAVKGTENRLTIPAKFIYETIQGLYDKKVAERVLGMFTFSDGSDDLARKAIEHSGIKLF